MKRKTPQGADGNLNKKHWLSTWQLMRVLHVIEQNERASFINTSQWKFKVKTSQQFKARENANWFWFESDWLKKKRAFSCPFAAYQNKGKYLQEPMSTH